eukprot:TRINITY_DN17035_c0_g1_i1.p1 TRINITY_DN17035_c0_g1~~TRINITY_DN17035_c0_g1_i1.p1  ORF type:complete len:670 (-),score=144.96 TRINITY_DN17035_c0_g1_i1:53-2062(-)
MVFYVVLLGVHRRPTPTASSSVFERLRFLAEPSGEDATTGSCFAAVTCGGSEAGSAVDTSGNKVGSACASNFVVDDYSVDGVRLFRATCGGSNLRGAPEGAVSLGARWGRGATNEDALPVQRTSSLFLLSIPSEVSLAELWSFLGTSLEDVEAVRVLRRAHRAANGSGAAAGAANERSDDTEDAAIADFYSVVILCKTQAGADALYKANHGRVFGSPGGGAAVSAAVQASTAGPCCYLVFLEVIVYVGTQVEASAAAVADHGGGVWTTGEKVLELSQDVPTVAYELPACPLCLERLDVSGTGMVTHSQGWLAESLYPPASCCRACPVISIAGGAHAADSRAADRGAALPPTWVAACETCGKLEEIWVCLICGHMGCGRYALGHAKDHAKNAEHRFCLELVSGRIWDYSSDVFVHRRLVQMAAATGRRWEVALPAPREAVAETGDVGPKHVHANESDLAMELAAILASQLDHQRSLLEAQLAEEGERQEQAFSRGQETLEEAEAEHDRLLKAITEAGRRRKTLERQLAAAKRASVEAEEQLGFIKELNQSLLANRRDIAASTAAGSTSSSTGGGKGGDCVAATVDGGSGGSSGGGSSAKADGRDDQSDDMVQRLRRRVAQLMEEISRIDEVPQTSGSGGTATDSGKVLSASGDVGDGAQPARAPPKRGRR